MLDLLPQPLLISLSFTALLGMDELLLFTTIMVALISTLVVAFDPIKQASMKKATIETIAKARQETIDAT